MSEERKILDVLVATFGEPGPAHTITGVNDSYQCDLCGKHNTHSVDCIWMKVLTSCSGNVAMDALRVRGFDTGKPEDEVEIPRDSSIPSSGFELSEDLRKPESYWDKLERKAEQILLTTLLIMMAGLFILDQFARGLAWAIYHHLHP